MKELMRDTAFGQLVRLASGKRLFKYAEEENPDLWKKFIDEKKSANLAHHGSVEPPEEGEEIHGLGGVRTRGDEAAREDSDASSRTHVGEDVNEASGVRVDEEKGRDINLVTWYGPDDPENPQVRFHQIPLGLPIVEPKGPTPFNRPDHNQY